MSLSFARRFFKAGSHYYAKSPVPKKHAEKAYAVVLLPIDDVDTKPYFMRKMNDKTLAPQLFGAKWEAKMAGKGCGPQRVVRVNVEEI